MPIGLFDAWFSDDEEPNEDIFYHYNVAPMHQIHIQLHELAHFLLGHPTLHINREILATALRGKGDLPFNELTRLRSTAKPEDSRAIREVESEILASVIQEQIIRHSQLEQLTRGILKLYRLTRFIKLSLLSSRLRSDQDLSLHLAQTSRQNNSNCPVSRYPFFNLLARSAPIFRRPRIINALIF